MGEGEACIWERGDGYKRKVDDLEQELERENAKVMSDPLTTPTPNNMSFAKLVQPVVVISPPEPTRPSSRKRGLGFMSADSESSATDVEPDSGDEVKFASGLPHRLFGSENIHYAVHRYHDDVLLPLLEQCSGLRMSHNPHFLKLRHFP